MRAWGRIRVAGTVAGLIGLFGVIGAGCSMFQNEQSAKGQKLYAHYCMHCHGEHGRQNEGFNWSSMTDPKPKDLSNKSEMGTFKDEDIFNTISRDMKDTSPNGDKIGDDEFAVPTMPTFKYTLSEEEIWAIVGYVRSLHGMKLEFKVDGRKKEWKRPTRPLSKNLKKPSAWQRKPKRRPPRKPRKRTSTSTTMPLPKKSR
ncbi:MAG: c-type cytochrome [Nitrospiraceae bacterium]